MKKDNIKSTHFKRKNHERTNRKIKANVLKIALFIILICLVKNLVVAKINQAKYKTAITEEEQKIEDREQAKAEVDVAKKVLSLRTDKAKRLVDNINNEIEFITLTEDGTDTVKHSRLSKDAGWLDKTFKNSKVSITFDYSAIFSIATKNIEIYISDGIVYINYNTDDIKVKSIETSNAVTESGHGWFGKKYSNQEVLSIVEIAKDKIYKELNTDNKRKEQSIVNLDKYFQDMASKVGVDKVVINGKKEINNTYNFIDNGTIKYNHGDKPLNNVKYIVIHSTAFKDKSALEFYNTYNRSEISRKANTHFFVDDENVVQMLPTNLQSWNCGTKKEPLIPCNNANSISIEICEFNDSDKQEKAINNCVKFVQEVLKVEFPDAEIVMHREVVGTKCPSVLTDEEFDKLFR
jgi:hypothetical protein